MEPRRFKASRESKTSSTFLEILAIGIAIKSLAKKNTAVEIICDSQPALFALERRYYKGAIEGQNIIIGLDKYCRHRDCHLLQAQTKRRS